MPTTGSICAAPGLHLDPQPEEEIKDQETDANPCLALEEEGTKKKGQKNTYNSSQSKTKSQS